ncbi:MAG: FAD-dependent monooxygenase [Candidatus Omnitrophica bacterium]|nr:FAD-dependent monooxygenase [Candidatus Omnitrophota bacterium]
MPSNQSTDICIVGGGPAGMVLGLLLASRGIKVTVLESHKNFDREYRGEVLMPRFIQMMKQVGLFDHLMKYPHLKLKNFELFWKDQPLVTVSIANLSNDAPFALWMPQPILLNALWDKAKAYPNFQILFGAMVRDVIRENGKIVGVIVEQEGEKFEIRSSVVVGADGRSSIVRKSADFEFEYESYDFDVIWFTVKHPVGYENTVRAFFSSRHRYLVLPKYPDSVQCGLIVPKGDFLRFRQRGIEAIRSELLDGHPVMHEFARGLKDFNDFNVLQARVSYVRKWAQDGCLLVGDAAHTCSPAGAIGVSVAVATAIVAADVLVKAFAKKDFSENVLSEVQEKRGQDVKRIQHIQSQFTSVFFLRYPHLQWLSKFGIMLAAKTGLLRRLQRELMVMQKPLPIESEISL